MKPLLFRVIAAITVFCVSSSASGGAPDASAGQPPPVVTLTVSPPSAAPLGHTLTAIVLATNANQIRVRSSTLGFDTGFVPSAGSHAFNLTAGAIGVHPIVATAQGPGGTSTASVNLTVTAPSGAPAYPSIDGFQWLSGGPDVPSGEWNSPTISDNGVYVVAASDTFSGVSVRFNRSAPSLTYQIVGAPCGSQAFCASYRPRMSGDGRKVVFESRWDYEVNDLASRQNIWIWDSQSGLTRRASVTSSGGAPNADAFIADISRDGRFVSFLSAATNISGSAGFGGNKAFRADMNPTPATVVHVSGAYNAVESARLSSNGNIIVFRADNQLIVRDTNQPAPEFLGWLGAGSDMADGEHSLALSPDGRFAAQSVFTGNDYGTYVFDRLSNTISPRILGSDNQGSAAVSSGAGFATAAACNFTNFYSARVAIHALSGNVASQGIADGALETCDFGIDITPKGDLITVSLPDLVVPDFGSQSTQQIFVVRNPLYQPLPANIAQYQGGIPASSSNVKSSASGRLVVFQSEIPAEQLLCFDAESQVYTPGCAPADTNLQPDVFRYDMDRNVVELVSSADGLNAAGGRNPDVDLTGEAIVYEAADNALTAKNLRDGRDFGMQRGKLGVTSIFLTQLIRSTSQRASTRVSVSRTGGMPNGSSQNPSISPNGRYIGFSTDATNINPGGDSNGLRDVVRVEPLTGSTVCISSCPGAIANAASNRPSVSNGGLVALESRAGALVEEYRGKGASPFTQIVVVDPDPGRRSVRTISRNAAGLLGAGNSERPRISGRGNAVVYQSAAPITADDSNGRVDVFLANLVISTNQRISRRPAPGGKANPFAPKADPGPEDGDSLLPAISGDGRYIAFQTTATNLVDTDTNGVTDLIVADVRSGQMRRIYQGFGGVETNGASETPHLNNNGTQIGFHSFATNLAEVGDGDNSTSEPYVRTNPQAGDVVFFDPFE